VGIELLSSWTCPYLFNISTIFIKVMVVMVKIDQIQYLSQAIRLYKKKQMKPFFNNSNLFSMYSKKQIKCL